MVSANTSTSATETESAPTVAAGALLMPAHFGKPFACRIEAKGDAFEPKFVG